VLTQLQATIAQEEEVAASQQEVIQKLRLEAEAVQFDVDEAKSAADSEILAFEEEVAVAREKVYAELKIAQEQLAAARTEAKAFADDQKVAVPAPAYAQVKVAAEFPERAKAELAVAKAQLEREVAAMNIAFESEKDDMIAQHVFLRSSFPFLRLHLVCLLFSCALHLRSDCAVGGGRPAQAPHLISPLASWAARLHARCR
jgi:hypothetical protein